MASELGPNILLFTLRVAVLESQYAAVKAGDPSTATFPHAPAKKGARVNHHLGLM